MKLFHWEFFKCIEDYLTEIFNTTCGYKIWLLRLLFLMYEKSCSMFTLKEILIDKNVYISKEIFYLYKHLLS